MFPQFNSNSYNPNNRPQINGANASSPQQIMGNQSNLFPNPMQFQPPFQVGMPNQLAVPPFTNPNTQFPPNHAFPFAQGGLQNLNANHLALFLAQNAVNMPQFSPNGLNALQSLLQNANQILQMQMSNFNPQSLGLLMNSQTGVANGTGMGQQPLDGYGLRNVFPSSSVTKDFGSSQPQGNPNTFSPSTSANAQDKLAPSEGNDRSSWIKPHSKNFVGSHIHNPSRRRYGNKQFHDQQNMKGNSKFNNINQDKEKNIIGLSNFNPSSNQIQAGKKSSITYTEKEIRQWREERRKNYPSTANLEKKLKDNITQQETTDAKIRRQQLKEILAKQSELGCPVAEVPSHYLSDSEVRINSRQNGKRQKFGNRFNEERKFQRNGRFHKRQRNGNSGSTSSQNQNDDSCQPHTHGTRRSTNQLAAVKKREPSLLKKLLSSDIKKDKSQLLQAFRFMVMNSFFENSPEKPLKFPTVIVGESGDESGVVDKKHLGNGVAPTGLASPADGGSDDSCAGEGG